VASQKFWSLALTPSRSKQPAQSVWVLPAVASGHEPAVIQCLMTANGMYLKSVLSRTQRSQAAGRISDEANSFDNSDLNRSIDSNVITTQELLVYCQYTSTSSSPRPLMNRLQSLMRTLCNFMNGAHDTHVTIGSWSALQT
jgi:hypothetical protein